MKTDKKEKKTEKTYGRKQRKTCPLQFLYCCLLLSFYRCYLGKTMKFVSERMSVSIFSRWYKSEATNPGNTMKNLRNWSYETKTIQFHSVGGVTFLKRTTRSHFGVQIRISQTMYQENLHGPLFRMYMNVSMFVCIHECM